MIKIGLEIHVQLNTKSKLFCGCAVNGNDEPNTRTCPVCLGYPGAKPVLNSKALEYAVKMAKVLGCKLNKKIFFSRKTYFYPDLAKNYQITQYEVPIGFNGKIKLKENDVTITRIHLEEDPGALVHPKGLQKSEFTLIDYNRSGIPLLEIVTEPEIQSAAQAREFMKKLKTFLGYLEIYSGGVVKADVNVSVRESGYVRAEVKNVTGFKEIEKTIEYEILRQRKELNEGMKLKQETRGWDAEKGITFLSRGKETEEDYGYIFDPDLCVYDIDENIKLPEMPDEKILRFVKKYHLDKEDAEVLASEKYLAEFFEMVAEEVDCKIAAKWIRRDLLSALAENNKTMTEIDHKKIIKLLNLFCSGKITDKVAKDILFLIVKKDVSPEEFVKKKGLEAVSDSSELERFAREAIGSNPKAVEDYKNGRHEALNFVVGYVMKKTSGKADPKKIKEIISRIA